MHKGDYNLQNIFGVFCHLVTEIFLLMCSLCIWCLFVFTGSGHQVTIIRVGSVVTQDGHLPGLLAPLWEPSPSHPIILLTRGLAVFCVYICYCMFHLSVYYLFVQYFDTVGWVF